MAVKTNRSAQSLGQILKQFDWDKKKYISQEFQDYGYRLAVALDDLCHKALYIKLAKEADRKFLEEAKNFVKDAYNVKSKAKLFMWKLKELKKGKPYKDE
ncbi:hypothetical protein KKD62_00565 [Patescibacteria group bacterium]|nr:hypothetical protein [Patescibacteria group bacterium]MBU1931371.1 hypothetical protein [Patescibacteria group bacterium]